MTAAMTEAEFGDTVSFQASPLLRPLHVAIALRRPCVTEFTDLASCGPGRPARQRMPGDVAGTAARPAGKPSYCGRKHRRSRDHLCRAFNLLHRHPGRRADRDRF